MDDNHEQAIQLQREYDEEVSFYLGANLDSPSSKIDVAKEIHHEKKKDSPSIDLFSLGHQKLVESDNNDSRSKSKGLSLTISTRNELDWLQVSSASSNGSKSPASQQTASVSPQTTSSLRILTASMTSSGEQNVSPSSNYHLFDEHERMFNEQLLPLSPVTPKTPSSSSSTRTPLSAKSNQSVALDHLENLVRMLQQLSQLHEENSALKKKCAFLEDTRSLLQLRNEMLTGPTPSKGKTRWSPKSQSSPPHTSKETKGKSLSPKGHMSSFTCTPIRMSTYPKVRQRMPSECHEEGMHSLSRSPLVKTRKRSQSVGSLDTLDAEVISKSVSKSSEKVKCDVMKVSRRKFSKWERVKMVFTGKPEPPHKELSPGKSTRDHQLSPTVLVHQASVDVMETSSSTKRKTKPPPIETPKGSDIIHSEPPSPGSTHSEPALSSSADIGHSHFEEFISPQIYLQQMSVPTDKELRRMSESTHSMSSIEDDDHDIPFVGSKETLKDDRSDNEHETIKSSSQYLQVSQLRRRRSSPTLWNSDNEEVATVVETMSASPKVSRSSSFKSSRKQSVPHSGEPKPKRTARSVDRSETREGRYSQSRRTAWGRVKDIIHTRRDSIKKRSKKDTDRPDVQSDSEADKVIIYDDFDSAPAALDYECDTPTASPPPQRKSQARQTGASPRSTPVLCRKARSMKTGTDSPPRPKTTQRPASTAFAGTSVDITALMGGMSDDFSRKMQEWEDKKSRRTFSVSKESIEADESESHSFSEEFIRKMEEWEKIKGRSYGSSPNKGRGSASFSPDKSCSPTELTAHPPSMEELQQRLSESFSKKLQEWERIKSQRAKEGSPTPGDKKSKKEDRNKSKKDHDKSKQKSEKIKGKDKSGFEKVKETLSEIRVKGFAGMEMALSEIRREGLSDEFTRKLHEWEQMKGLKHEHSETSFTTGAATTMLSASSSLSSSSTLVQSQQLRSSCTVKEEQQMSSSSSSRERIHSDSSVHEASHFSEFSAASFLTSSSSTQGGLMERSMTSSSSQAGTLDRSMTDSALSSSPMSLVDDSTSIDLSITSEHVLNLEKTNVRLLEELKQKREEDISMKKELHQLQARLNLMSNQHKAEIEIYKRELWATSHLGRVTIETDLMAATVNELKQKIEQLEDQGELLAEEKSQLEMRMFEESVDRCQTEARLVEEVQNLRRMINNANKDNQSSYIPQAGGQSYDKLYHYVLSLQAKLNELKHSMLERNQLIGDMKRHLMMQEVTNILTKAGMNRRELELSYFKEAKRLGVLRRWKTFAGAEFKFREGQKKNGNGKPNVIPRHHVQKTCKDYEAVIERLNRNNADSLFPSFDWLEGRQAKPNLGDGEGYLKQQLPKGYGPEGGQKVSPPSHRPAHSSIGVQAPISPSQLRSVAIQTQNSAAQINKAVQSITMPTTTVVTQTLLPSTEEQFTQTMRTRRARDNAEMTTKSVASRAVQTAGTCEVTIRRNPLKRQTSLDQSEVVPSIGTGYTSPLPQRSSRVQGSKHSSLPTGTTMHSKTVESPTIATKRWTSKLTSCDGVSSPSDSTGKTKASAAAADLQVSFTVKLTPQSSFETLDSESEKQDTITEYAYSDEQKDHLHGETLSDWLKREPKPPPQVVRNSNVIVNVPSSEAEGMQTETVTVCVVSGSTARKSQHREPIRKQDSVGNLSNTSTDDGEVFVDARSHLPHSPMIRSKNPRKWRQEHECAHPVNVCTFQATPPRRHIRHRRGSIDKSDIENMASQLQSEPNRGRSKTRNETTPRACSVGARFKISDPVTRTEQRIRARESLPTVKSTITKFEKQASLDSPPYKGSAPNSPSPGPPRRLRVSPARRLKTAAELLQDSAYQRHQLSAQQTRKNNTPGQQTEITTTTFVKTRAMSSSSDKENSESKVRKMVRQFSKEGTPSRSSASSISESAEFSSPAQRRTPSPSTRSSSVIQQAVGRLTSLSPEMARSKPILKDLTNDGQVKKLTETFRNGSVSNSPTGGATPTGSSTPGSRNSPVRIPGERKRSLESPKEGTVQKCTEMFERKTSPAKETGPKSGSRKSSLSESNILNVKPESPKCVEKKDKPCKQASDIKKCEGTSIVQRSKSSVKTRLEMPDSSGTTEVKKRNRSVSPSKARRFFSRSSKQMNVPSYSQGSSGAISMLCRQTMNIDSDKISIESEHSSRGDTEDAAIVTAEGGSKDTTVDKRRSKGKFLDGNWLHKPRRFFRVSK